VINISHKRTQTSILRCLGALTVLTILSLGSGCAGAIRTGDRALDARLTQLMNDLEAERVAAHIPGMAIAIVQGDNVLVTRGFGWREVARRQPVTPDTLFAIGSSTKSMTTALTAMLVQEGRLDWDDPVQRYLPEFELKDPDVVPTFRDVYSHRTGLTRLTLLWAGNQVPRDEIIRRVVDAKPYAGFREQFLYNNITFMAGGMATANAAGADSWESLLQQRLLKPLNMQRSNVNVADLLADPDHATGYFWNERTKRWEKLEPRVLTAVAPAGAVNSSVREMTRWLRMLLSGGEFAGQQIIAPEQLEQVWEPQIGVGGGASYGLGWFISYWNGFKVVNHGGNIDGFASSVGLIPEKGIGVVLLQNVSSSPLQQKVLPMVWSAILDKAPPEKKDAPEQESEPGEAWSAEELTPYLGRYHLEALKVDCTVLIQDGKLAVDVPGQMVYTLKWPDQRGRWVFDFTDTIEVDFDDPAEGVVPGMTMHQTIMTNFTRTSEVPAGKLPSEALSDGSWTQEQLTALTGTYRGAPGPQGEWTLSVRDGRLHAYLPGQQHWPLKEPDADGWWKFEVDETQQLRFTANADGLVNGFAFRRMLAMPMPRVDVDEDLATVLDELLASRGMISETSAWYLTGRNRLIHQGVSGRYESWFDGSGRTLDRVDMSPFGQTTSVTDGDSGWVKSNIERTRSLSQEETQRARAESYLRVVGDWRKWFDETKVVREERLGGEPVYVVTCRLGDKTPLTRWVHQASGNVLQDEFASDSNGLGSLLLKTTYDDYREVGGGFEVPFNMQTEHPSLGVIEVQIESIEVGQPWPTGILDKPSDAQKPEAIPAD
jgi:CubicO group peptidase (beta-lactamase class C family)